MSRTANSRSQRMLTWLKLLNIYKMERTNINYLCLMTGKCLHKFKYKRILVSIFNLPYAKTLDIWLGYCKREGSFKSSNLININFIDL